MSGRVLSKHASVDLSAEAFSQTFDFDNSGRLLSVYVHASAAITEDIIISFDSKEGTVYHTVIAERTTEAETDYVYSSAGMVAFSIGDKVKVEVTNANTTGVVGVTVKFETSYHG